MIIHLEKWLFLTKNLVIWMKNWCLQPLLQRIFSKSDKKSRKTEFQKIILTTMTFKISKDLINLDKNLKSSQLATCCMIFFSMFDIREYRGVIIIIILVVIILHDKKIHICTFALGSWAKISHYYIVIEK